MIAAWLFELSFIINNLSSIIYLPYSKTTVSEKKTQYHSLLFLMFFLCMFLKYFFDLHSLDKNFDENNLFQNLNNVSMSICINHSFARVCGPSTITIASNSPSKEEAME